MRWIRVLVSRVRAALCARRLDEDLAEELRSHIEIETEANRQRGMPAELARQAALREFGGLTQTAETYRERRGLPLVETTVQDIVHAVRVFRKAPGLTSVAILSLGLGVGVNTAIFGIVNTAFLRPLPAHDPDQLVTLSFDQRGASTHLFSYPDYRDIRDQSTAAFTDILAYRVGLDALNVNGQADRILVHYVTGNYFTELGVNPALGRLILPSEGEAPGADPVLVLGYAYWRMRFGGDPNVIGTRVQIDGHPVTIVGVAPQEFRSVQAVIDVQGYLPLGMVLVEGNYPRNVLISRNMRMFSLIGRLRPGVAPRQAGTVLNAVSMQLSHAYPTLLGGFTIGIQREALGRIPLGRSDQWIVVSTLFLGISALVIVLACVNLANLLVARAAARSREMAVRAALGGSRGRLIRQLLTECAVLACLGSLGGLALGMLTGRAFGTPEVQGIPIHLEAQFDWRVFGYAVAATALTSLMLGALPALRGSRVELTAVLREGGQRLSTGGRRVRAMLVAAQVAGSFALLIVAGLMIRSLEHAQQLDLGFDAAHIVTFGLDPHHLGYDAPRGGQFYEELLRRVRALPGVESASLGCCGPMSPSPLFAPLRLDGTAVSRDLMGQSDSMVFFNQVSRGFFETLRIPIVGGRAFEASDGRDAPRVAILNQSMAERFWPGRDPIGQKFRFSGDTRPPMQVVGVVKDGRYLGISDRPQPYFFVPLEQNYGSSEVLFVRSGTAPATVMASVRREISALAPGMPVTGVETMADRLDESGGLGLLRKSALLAAALGGLGLALAVLGVYGVVSYSAARRTHEIGVRVALGAPANRIRALVLTESAASVSAGLVAGVALSLAAAPVVRRFLIEISPTDPKTYGEVAALLVCVTLAACYIPLRHALRVDPMVALRQE